MQEEEESNKEYIFVVFKIQLQISMIRSLFRKISEKSTLKLSTFQFIRSFGTGPVFLVNNPLTGQPCMQYQNSDTNSDMQKQIQSLEGRVKTWKQLNISQKKSHLTNFITKMEENKSKLVEIMNNSTGKTLKQCYEELDLAIQMLKCDFEGNYEMQFQKGKGNKYYLQPFNNILVVYDHRFPVMSSLKYLTQCAIAGAGMILKPERYALPISKAIQSLWKSTVPDHPIMYCPVNMFSDGLEFLIQHEHTGHVSFTGDIQAGNTFYHFMASNSEIFAQSQFLLASNDAAYVSKSLSMEALDKCVNYLVRGCFSGAGNHIDSIKRIFVNKQIEEIFIGKFLEASKIYNIDHQNTEMSAILTSKHIKAAKTLIQQLEEYKNPELKLLTDINSLEQGKSIKFSPVIYKIEGIPDIQYWTKIYPLPIVFIEAVSGVGSVSQKINQSIYGNNACIFTSNLEDIEKIGNDIQVGTVNINRWGLVPGVPYAARKRSGKGFSFSQFTFDNILRSKSINMDSL